MALETLSLDALKKESPIFGQTSFDNHEQVVFCRDKDTGLNAIIGIHDTTLGPALGGTRMYNYSNESAAIEDVLRLSRGMTFKAAITGVNLGGGKAVIIGDPKLEKTPEMMRRFGTFVNSLGGNYITAEDVGTTTTDMDNVREKTAFVTGVSKAKGGSGDPSPVTAYGVFMGMKAAARYAYGTDGLKGRKVLVEGIGHVGEELVRLLSEAGATPVLSDINEARLQTVSKKYSATIYRGADLYSETADIYAPCALGATLNPETIKKLAVKVIAGAANNQLLEEQRDGQLLMQKGIIYAPDFLINAGGLISVYAELKGLDERQVIFETENIYNTTLEILEKSEVSGMTSHASALHIAQARITNRKKEIYA